MTDIDVSDILGLDLFPLNFQKINSFINESGRAEETIENITIQGNIQNYHSQNKEILKEGFRGWIYKQLQVDKYSYQFKINDKVIYETIEYLIIEKKDYQEYGYIKYILQQNYQ